MKEMQAGTHRLQAAKTARYFTLNGGGSVERIWMVLHGYGQLAESFLRTCSALARPGTLVVAPEGLSRFYVKGFFGNVGATWMTREARQDDILDNMAFLDGVLKDVLDRIGNVPGRLSVLGYSQGGPTAARWTAITGSEIDDLVMWCSDFPRDLGDGALDTLRRLNLWYVHASADEFMDEELFGRQTAYLDSQGIGYRLLPFEGKHEIRDDVLAVVDQAVRGDGSS